MGEKEEVSLLVPLSLVRETVGLAVDMGGSVIKFVYRSKENEEEAKKKTSGLGHLQLVSFARPDIELALDHVKARCVITRHRESDEPEVRSTGIGCTQFGKKIASAFNVSLRNITEFDCFINAFMYLTNHLSRKELFHVYDDEATEEPIQTLKAQMAFMSATKDDGFSESLKSFKADSMDISSVGLGKIVNESDAPVAEVEDLYPCILAACGSGFAYNMIKADKTFVTLDGSSRGGLSCYGIGRLLTGCKTFPELLELASRGDTKNVDVYTDAMISSFDAADGDISLYAQIGNVELPPTLVYHFGKAVEAKITDFRREDLARAWLNFAISDAAHSLHMVCMLHGIKRLFFAGSFCNTALVRGIITTEIVRKNIFASSFGFKPVAFDFVKPGPHLGALGALISEASSHINGESTSL